MPYFNSSIQNKHEKEKKKEKKEKKERNHCG